MLAGTKAQSSQRPAPRSQPQPHPRSGLRAPAGNRTLGLVGGASVAVRLRDVSAQEERRTRPSLPQPEAVGL